MCQNAHIPNMMKKRYQEKYFSDNGEPNDFLSPTAKLVNWTCLIHFLLTENQRKYLRLIRKFLLNLILYVFCLFNVNVLRIVKELYKSEFAYQVSLSNMFT